MSEKQNGYWVKLYQKSLHSSVWQAGANVWMVWCWCLMRANSKTTKVPFNGKDHLLLPGQFITGRNKASKEVGISVRSYRTAISYLKSTSRLTIKNNNKFSIITIQNWSTYQTNDQHIDQQRGQPATSQRPQTRMTKNVIEEERKPQTFKNPYLTTEEMKSHFPRLKVEGYKLFDSLSPAFFFDDGNMKVRGANGEWLFYNGSWADLEWRKS